MRRTIFILLILSVFHGCKKPSAEELDFRSADCTMQGIELVKLFNSEGFAGRAREDSTLDFVEVPRTISDSNTIINLKLRNFFKGVDYKKFSENDILFYGYYQDYWIYNYIETKCWLDLFYRKQVVLINYSRKKTDYHSSIGFGVYFFVPKLPAGYTRTVVDTRNF